MENPPASLKSPAIISLPLKTSQLSSDFALLFPHVNDLWFEPGFLPAEWRRGYPNALPVYMQLCELLLSRARVPSARLLVCLQHIKVTIKRQEAVSSKLQENLWVRLVNQMCWIKNCTLNLNNNQSHQRNFSGNLSNIYSNINYFQYWKPLKIHCLMFIWNLETVLTHLHQKTTTMNGY